MTGAYAEFGIIATIMGLSAHLEVVTEPSDSHMANRVDEALLKRSIKERAIRWKIRKKRSWAEILRHPTANMIIGFLLTGILGAGVTNYYSMQRQKEKQHAEMVAANKESVSNGTYLSG